MIQSATPKRRYILGLDGLRALAVLSVIFYHLGFKWASGGFLGVVVFFVLSGYLITDLLVEEWDRHQHIHLKKFWLKRAKRLLPAIFLLLLILIGWVSLFDRSFLHSLREDCLAALFYFSNWWYIFHNQSYFDSFANPSLLNHFWSLAVEEQFYLVWPLLLMLGFRFIPRRLLFLLIVIIATISAIAMGVLYQPGLDPSRVYYGTDTRAFSLLIGAALALYWPSQKLAFDIPKGLKYFLNTIGAVALLVILFMLWRTNQYENFLYRGGMVLVSLITAILVAVLVHPANSISKLFSIKPLQWLGVRSYGIYLWHYPIITLTTPSVNTDGISLIRVLIQLVLIIGLSALSYKYIENPIRRHGFSNSFKMMKNWFEDHHISFARVATLAGAILILMISLVVVSNDPSASGNKKEYSKAAMKEYDPKEPIKQIKNKPSEKNEKQQHQDVESENSKETTSSKTENTKEEKQTVTNLKDIHTTAIGDSILLDVAPFLKDKIPSMTVDAEVGRQMYQAIRIVERMVKNGSLGDTVIIEQGTNGAFTKDQLESMIQTIGNDKQIILVNTRVPRPWESVVNSTLKEVAPKYSNVTLVDWYTASKGHNEYFAPDGVHLNKSGSQAYANLVLNKIKK
ncbi:acyltransferase family protein [Heyndrickxia oleronia]|uniref:acyltransferase family protein n=1 Tax=Heyndrickxia oleronia TaxID=38875 RepID=UPI001C0F33E0|nr:acyltransferase family protein [Heyndrickxia oleronia]MBU5214418.1 acetyltransferase [Heyndrickxia oleronia]